MARLLIVNADDFGLSNSVNQGIVRAHVLGIVTSTSLMVDRPAAAEAAEHAGRLPDLSVGLHFVEPDGVDIDDDAQLAKALTGQIDRFHKLVGRGPTHLDSHHHVHLEGRRRQAFAAAGQALDVPVRGDGSVNYIGGFYGQWEWGVTDLSHVQPEYLDWLLREEVFDGLNEIACHPAAIADLDSTYNHERLIELETLTRPELRDSVEQLGISLIGYDGWRRHR